MRRIALFGGTFNPVHLGHLRVAEEVRERFAIDKVYFIPAANPPHKPGPGLAPAEDRYEMLLRATQENPAFDVSELELQRSGRSYTIDTVKQISGSMPEDTRCWLVMGVDAFEEIETWKSYTELFEYIEIIVLSRPSDRGGGDLIEVVSRIISDRVSAQYRFEPENRRFVHPGKRAVYPFSATLLDISASRIRSLTKAKASVRYLVPESVETYIHEKGLYL
ncbi:MAG: nicotinate-nucleotide adenylyltransferase [Desulfobacteraceae bacterium]|nr:nicotinate-nucleotide adenylyltransferase [Desulfobacteraceae bacterium]